MDIRNFEELKNVLSKIVADTHVVDIHTHLFSPDHGQLCVWGIDELLTYHYLVAEFFRFSDMEYNVFFKLSKREQAELIWKALFVDRTPVSEACRGVVTCLSRLGIDARERNLEKIRKFYSRFSTESYIDWVFKSAGIESVVMTNDPFEPDEYSVWRLGRHSDPRFKPALRMENALRDWNATCRFLAGDGFKIGPSPDAEAFRTLRCFFDVWADRMRPVYLAASLAPDFRYPECKSLQSVLVRDVMLPLARDRKLPVAQMIGVRRGVNTQMELAGDGLGTADVLSVEALCRDNPDIKFLVTILGREYQHPLCVAARKFRNLMVFGCWWYLNIPSMIKEITCMRLELLGLSMIPQHSDCRVLDQLIYKWDNSRRIIQDVLLDKYSSLMNAGWILDSDRVRQDVELLFSKNFKNFCS